MKPESLHTPEFLGSFATQEQAELQEIIDQNAESPEERTRATAALKLFELATKHAETI